MTRFPGTRKPFVVLLDMLLIILGLIIAFYLRFDAKLPENEVANLFRWAPVLVVVRIIFFYTFGLYHGIWRYARPAERR